jgi:nucleoside-diphosphate-sugar epimerase
MPRCLLRNFNKAARIKRFPSDIVLGDVLDYDSLVRAMAGCDAVIHCAYGNTPDDALSTKINVEGTKNLLRVAIQNQVKRFVYLSSVEVYGQHQPHLVNEDTPTQTSVYSYGNSKLEAEKLCIRAYQEHNLPIVILRLSAVYGPYAPWTVNVINRLVHRGFCQNKHFNGLCNPLYIDDCVDAIFLAVGQSGIEGETFLISGDETLTWNEYFARYNDMLGMPPLKTASMLELKFYQAVRQGWDTVLHCFKPQSSTNMVFRYNSLREQGKIPNLRTIIHRGSLLKSFEIFNRQTCYSSEKARKRLGFSPQYDFPRGLAMVQKWCQGMR